MSPGWCRYAGDFAGNGAAGRVAENAVEGECGDEEVSNDEGLMTKDESNLKVQ